MAAELTNRGANPGGHLSRSVTTRILEEVDVVLTVELAHRRRLAEGWPEHAAKVFGLNQLAEAMSRVGTRRGGLAALDDALAVAKPDSMAWDVADPYRRGRAAARACADEIDAALAGILPALDGIPAPSGLGRPPGRW
jgi:protein-tyrosine-phosphatase